MSARWHTASSSAFTPERPNAITAVARKIARQMGYYMRLKTVVSRAWPHGCRHPGLVAWNTGCYGRPVFLFELHHLPGQHFSIVPPVAVALLQFSNPWMAVAIAALLGLNRFLWIDLVRFVFSGKTADVDSICCCCSWRTGAGPGASSGCCWRAVIDQSQDRVGQHSDTWPLARLMSEE